MVFWVLVFNNLWFSGVFTGYKIWNIGQRWVNTKYLFWPFRNVLSKYDKCTVRSYFSDRDIYNFQEFNGSLGNRDSRVVWMGNYDYILGTGFDKVISDICIVGTLKNLKKNWVNVIVIKMQEVSAQESNNLSVGQVLMIREQ